MQKRKEENIRTRIARIGEDTEPSILLSPPVFSLDISIFEFKYNTHLIYPDKASYMNRYTFLCHL